MKGKVIRNGMVAVIVSPGFGAGWSTWNEPEDCFDPLVIEWIEAGKPRPIPYDDEDSDKYNGGLPEAELRWLPQGTPFLIEDYDGNEILRTPDSVGWMCA